MFLSLLRVRITSERSRVVVIPLITWGTRVQSKYVCTTNMTVPLRCIISDFLPTHMLTLYVTLSYVISEGWDHHGEFASKRSTRLVRIRSRIRMRACTIALADADCQSDFLRSRSQKSEVGRIIMK
ncbi:hypothetical protein CPB84DRAFT_1392384 [Gymnopilus junonius]|uniref:Uncharacterized protein n=1 Tax=Gymnopilus junonius TaxID=109634 RepID=A0A9P5TLE8_GYMJU|nr:hypothetical protein CPB84DRAFT_1392384 [Gymnopilus junonius]